MRRSLVGWLLLVVLACIGGFEPRPLDVTIQANQATAAVGETVRFVVNAQGDRLVNIVIDFGDDVEEQVAVGSARIARVAFEHAYAAIGTYEVRATALDAVAGSKQTTVEVTIQ